MAKLKRLTKHLAFSVAQGAIFAAGLGFFLFVRLGFPKDANTAGYVSGLLLVAGLKFGLILGVVRYLFSEMCRRTGESSSTQPGSDSSLDLSENQGSFPIPALPPSTLSAGQDSPSRAPAKPRASNGDQHQTKEVKAPRDKTPQHLEADQDFDSRHAPRHSLAEIFRFDQLGRLRIPVSVVMPVLNEADRLTDALRPLHWADEVIVVDGGSRDRTVEIARAKGVSVLQVSGSGIAAQRNAGIVAARNPWVLALDVDERIPDLLLDEIASVLRAPEHSAYRIRFRNFYLGREMKHGCWGRDWHVRLFRREHRFAEKRVHEGLEQASDVGQLFALLEHTPYKDLGHHLEKMIRYASWGAQDLHANGRRPRFPGVTFVPAWRFLREYFLFSGWRDGERGLVSAALSACAALLKYAHLYAIEWNRASAEAEIERTAALARPTEKTTPILPPC